MAKNYNFLFFSFNDLFALQKLPGNLVKMEKTKIKLSIVILNWNTKELLKQCLESVVRCLVLSDRETKKKTTNTQPPVPKTEIIVVDNNSSDSSVKMIEEMMMGTTRIKSTTGITGIKLIRNKKNLGYAMGNNVGIKAADGEYIMILNTDTFVKKDSIEKLIDFLDVNKNVDIVGPRLLNSDGTPQANCGRFPDLLVSAVMLFKEHFGGSKLVRFSPKESQLVDWLMGSAFVARKKVFEKIGGFDEKIFMYMEEIEWFYRAKKTGFKTYFLKDAEIIHLGRGSSKSGKKEPILNIYKGLIYFYKKHKSLPELVILRLMLKFKALAAFLLGFLSNNRYLKETYGEAFKLN